MATYFTTQDVAKMLKVSRVTIRNWIMDGNLEASATPGGHWRIEKTDLKNFFLVFGHSTDIIKKHELIKSDNFIFCWEYQAKHFVTGAHLHNCKNCLVFLSRSQRCHVVFNLVGYCKVFCMEECATCNYYNKYLSKQHRDNRLSA